MPNAGSRQMDCTEGRFRELTDNVSEKTNNELAARRSGPRSDATRERERSERSGGRSSPHPDEPSAGGRRPDREQAGATEYRRTPFLAILGYVLGFMVFLAVLAFLAAWVLRLLAR